MTKTLLNEAMKYALTAHGDQQYGRKPYHAHLMDVVQVLVRFHDWDELSQHLINAAWLHDVVEDTDRTDVDILTHFGLVTSGLVFAVTNGAGATRAERHKEVYRKIRKTPGAIVLKLADRIANLEQCVSHDRIGRKPGKLFNMYADEWAGFQHELRGHCAGEGYIADAMWGRLDELFNEGLQ